MHAPLLESQGLRERARFSEQCGQDDRFVQSRLLSKGIAENRIEPGSDSDGVAAPLDGRMAIIYLSVAMER
jgi:hypothetical protein